MAEAYAALSKWQEASALYERALERNANCALKLKQLRGSPYINEKPEDIETLSSNIQTAKMLALSNRISETADEVQEYKKNNNKVGANESNSEKYANLIIFVKILSL